MEPLTTLFGPESPLMVSGGQGQLMAIATVTNPANPIVRSFSLDSARIIFTAATLSEIAKAYSTVHSLLEKWALENPEVDLRLSAIGYNTEHEWKDLPQGIEDWLRDRFTRDLNLRAGTTIRPQLIRFSVATDKPRAPFWNVAIEPRMGNERALFMFVNEHHNALGEDLPEPAALGAALENAVRNVEVEIARLLRLETDA